MIFRVQCRKIAHLQFISPTAVSAKKAKMESGRHQGEDRANQWGLFTNTTGRPLPTVCTKVRHVLHSINYMHLTKIHGNIQSWHIRKSRKDLPDFIPSSRLRFFFLVWAFSDCFLCLQTFYMNQFDMQGKEVLNKKGSMESAYCCIISYLLRAAQKISWTSVVT
jgi:hypothetical protein